MLRTSTPTVLSHPLSYVSIACLLLPIATAAANDQAHQKFSMTSGYFYRDRSDADIKQASYPGWVMESNVANFIFAVSSDLVDRKVTADLAWIGAINFNRDFRCSEVAFCSKSTDSQTINDATNIWAHNKDMDGIALSRASLKTKLDLNERSYLSAKAGYDQFNAGILRNNWGFLFPGSYRGAQVDLQIANTHIAYAWSDYYRTPWATEYGALLTPGGEKIDYLHSLGIEHRFSDNFDVELAAGQSHQWQDRLFSKLNGTFPGNQFSFYTSFQYYHYQLTGLDGKQREDAYGKQNAITFDIQTPYGFRLNNKVFQTQTNSWFEVPEYIPRLTYGYGTSNGRVDYWFDAASLDFNKDGELVMFSELSFDAYKFANVSISPSVAIFQGQGISGWNPTTLEKIDSDGYERGYYLDLKLSVLDGPLHGLYFNAHYASIKAGGSEIPEAPTGLFYKYGLRTTNDLKIMLIHQLEIETTN